MEAKIDMETLTNTISEIRQKADYCHNNQLSKTYEDWEHMCAFLLSMADRLDEIRREIGNAARIGTRNCDVYDDCDRAYSEYKKFLGDGCEDTYRMDGAFNAIFWMLKDGKEVSTSMVGGLNEEGH